MFLFFPDKMFIKKIVTADQSETFLNLTVGESYHSQTGAVEEALKKYVLPCKIREKAKSGKLCILDFCFGIGYNSAMAVEAALKENPNCDIEVVGLENDPKIIEKIQEVNPPIETYLNYKKINPKNLSVSWDKVRVVLKIGDGRDIVRSLESDHFDAIFYDPFSPKTSPEMWSSELFKEMWRVLKKDGILATYSCARMVRENMKEADLIYEDGPIVGRRGPGTIAKKWIF
jgi:tRNA U34 5-methylaminomethyl-2-thiouridine-forming methyltransferase MnmC